MIADDPRWDAELLDALRRQVMDEPAATLDAQRRAADAAALAGDVDGVAKTDSRDRWVLARGRRVQCRVHRPRPDAVLPALVFLHGGGWVFGSLDTHDRLMRELALAGDVAVVGVDYALSPEAVFPQAAEECAAVFRQVMAEAAAWGLDPRRIVLGGDSAGGNLAFATALLLRDALSDPAPGGPPDGAPDGPLHGAPDGVADPAWQALRGVLAIYPVCDSAMDSASYTEFATGYGLDAPDMAWFWERYVPDAATRATPLASVGRAALHALPPVLIQAAELDVLCGEGEAMAARLREAGVAVRHEVAPGAPHGFLAHSPSSARSREALAQAGEWLRERCRP
jgi:acetyl esterase